MYYYIIKVVLPHYHKRRYLFVIWTNIVVMRIKFRSSKSFVFPSIPIYHDWVSIYRL